MLEKKIKTRGNSLLSNIIGKELYYQEGEEHITKKASLQKDSEISNLISQALDNDGDFGSKEYRKIASNIVNKKKLLSTNRIMGYEGDENKDFLNNSLGRKAATEVERKACKHLTDHLNNIDLKSVSIKKANAKNVQFRPVGVFKKNAEVSFSEVEIDLTHPALEGETVKVSMCCDRGDMTFTSGFQYSGHQFPLNKEGWSKLLEFHKVASRRSKPINLVVRTFTAEYPEGYYETLGQFDDPSELEAILKTNGVIYHYLDPTSIEPVIFDESDAAKIRKIAQSYQARIDGGSTYGGDKDKVSVKTTDKDAKKIVDKLEGKVGEISLSRDPKDPKSVNITTDKKDKDELIRGLTTSSVDFSEYRFIEAAFADPKDFDFLVDYASDVVQDYALSSGVDLNDDRLIPDRGTGIEDILSYAIYTGYTPELRQKIRSGQFVIDSEEVSRIYEEYRDYLRTNIESAYSDWLETAAYEEGAGRDTDDLVAYDQEGLDTQEEDEADLEDVGGYGSPDTFLYEEDDTLSGGDYQPRSRIIDTESEYQGDVERSKGYIPKSVTTRPSPVTIPNPRRRYEESDYENEDNVVATGGMIRGSQKGDGIDRGTKRVSAKGAPYSEGDPAPASKNKGPSGTKTTVRGPAGEQRPVNRPSYGSQVAKPRPSSEGSPLSDNKGGSMKDPSRNQGPGSKKLLVRGPAGEQKTWSNEKTGFEPKVKRPVGKGSPEEFMTRDKKHQPGNVAEFIGNDVQSSPGRTMDLEMGRYPANKGKSSGPQFFRQSSVLNKTFPYPFS